MEGINKQETRDTDSLEIEGGADYRKQKFIQLYTARSIIAKYGTMPERRLVRKQLKLMEKKRS